MPAHESKHYYKQLHLQQLRSFCLVAGELSFSSTAVKLGVSRPTVWHQVRALERELDASLLRRQGRRLELTEDGRLLLDMVHPLVSSFDAVRASFQNRKHNLPLRLVVAATGGHLAGDLKPVIRTFLDRHPEVHLSLLDRGTPEALRLVAGDQVDLAVASLPEEQVCHPILEIERLGAKPYLLALPPRHELASRSVLRLRDLVRHPWVFWSGGSRSRSRVERVLREHGLLEKWNIILETTNGHLILEYVALGVGISLTTRRTKLPIRVRDVSRWFGEEPIVLAHRKGSFQPPHVQFFCELVRAAMRRKV